MQSAVHKDMAFIEKVKTFLAAGSVASPKELFSQMGIDIDDRAFWQSGMSEIRSLLAEVSALTDTPL
jgi:oligoendopeptidase F